MIRNLFMMIIMIEKIRQDLKIQKTALSKTMVLIFFYLKEKALFYDGCMSKYISLLLLLLHHKTFLIWFMSIIKYVSLISIGAVSIIYIYILHNIAIISEITTIISKQNTQVTNKIRKGINPVYIIWIM